MLNFRGLKGKISLVGLNNYIKIGWGYSENYTKFWVEVVNSGFFMLLRSGDEDTM